jgi:hypothetical protein
MGDQSHNSKLIKDLLDEIDIETTACMIWVNHGPPYNPEIHKRTASTLIDQYRQLCRYNVCEVHIRVHMAAMAAIIVALDKLDLLI